MMKSHYTCFSNYLLPHLCIDQVTQLNAEQFAQDELYDRLNTINERLNTLKIESEEVYLFYLFVG